MGKNNEYYKTLCDFYNKNKICVVSDKDSINEIVKFISSDGNGKIYPWNKMSCYTFQDDLNGIEDSVIFCKNSFEVFYIENKTKTNIVLSIESVDALLILYLNEIYHLSQKNIDKCVEVFSCTRVVFEGKNDYIDYLCEMLCRAGVEVCIKNNNTPMKVILTIDGDEIKCSLVEIVFNILYMMEHLCDIDSSLIDKNYLFNMIDEYYYKSICNKDLFKIILKKKNSSEFENTIENILQKRFDDLSVEKKEYKIIKFGNILDFLRKILEFIGYKMIIDMYQEINNNIYCYVIDSFDQFKFELYRTPAAYLRGEKFMFE